jgi:uncharacterized membrane protein YphA (DoxX/SURF4 family)
MSPALSGAVILDPALHWILRAALALLFAAAALHKLRDRRRFEATLGDYRVLPEAIVPAAAAAVPGLELAVAVLLLAPLAVPAAALAGAGLLAVYSAAIAANLARGRRHIDCGCLGGRGREPLSASLLARNGALVAACLVLAASRPGGRGLAWVDFVSIAGGVAVLALLFTAAQTLASGWTRARRAP